MAKLMAPGVIVEEVGTLPNVAIRLSSATPAFLGYTNADPLGAVYVPNLQAFEKQFGEPGILAKIDLNGTFGQSYANYHPIKFLYLSLSLYFANGGGPCWVISIGKDTKALSTQRVTDALTALEQIPEVALVLFPELTSTMATNQVQEPDNILRATVVQAILAHCAKCGNRFALFDVFMRWRTAGMFQAPVNDTLGFREQAGSQNLSYGAAYYPQVTCDLPIPDSAVELISGNPSINGKTLKEVLETASGTDTNAAQMAKLIYPALATIRQRIAVGIKPNVGASAAVAAIIGRLDVQRGQWKAPANEPIIGAQRVFKMWWGDQNEALGQVPGERDIEGKDINEIKNKANGEVLVWGARTLAGRDLNYRYIPVRRLMMMIANSLKSATQFAVFEPNTATTWIKLQTMVEHFLQDLWRDGALMGSKPEEAYRVRIGLGKSMTADDVLQGILRIEVAVAPVRPAEFIELRFFHSVQPI